MSTWRLDRVIRALVAVMCIVFCGLASEAADFLPVTNALVCQYVAGVGVTNDGSGVLTWTDISGNGRTGTRASGNPAQVTNVLNKRAIVQFRGGDDWLNVAGTMFTKEQ